MPFNEHHTVASPTGAALSLHVQSAERTPRGVVQVNHGFAEHALRYERFADFLGVRGYTTYVHDHRGHGQTKAPDAPPQRFAHSRGVDAVLKDVLAVHETIGHAHPGLPVIVFGHSMGGLIALNFMLRHSDRVSAAAIWNANFSAGPLGKMAQAILAWERFRLGSDVPSRLLPKLTFRQWGRSISGHATPTDWLSRDHAEVELYRADPLCGWDGSVSMWQDVFRMIFNGADERNFAAMRRDLPINLVGGGQDPSTGNGKAVLDLAARMKRMGFSNLVSTIYPDNRHESLNELNRDTVMRDFADWLDGVVGPKKVA